MAVSEREKAIPTATAAPGAHIAEPAPLGLAGFAMTTMVLSVFNAFLIHTGGAVVLGLALFYGGLAQLIAGLWEFAKGNTFGATAFCSYGAFWLSYWFLGRFTDLSTAKGNDVNHAIGVFLLAWAIFTAYMFVSSTRVSLAVAAVFAALTITFLFLAIGNFAMKLGDVTNGWVKIGGWLGLVTALLAWYASFAGVTNATYKRTVLPTFPRT